jgi:hypothetical protein
MGIAELRTWLSYDPASGHLTWLKRSGHIKPGTVAGTPHSLGYIILKLRTRRYYAHRLAWAIHFGEWPPEQIDHINGNGRDNRIVNLRLANNSQNNTNHLGPRRNNTSGMTGVYWRKPEHKWVAQIVVDGRHITLGRFDTRLRAVMARLEAEAKYQGDYAWVPEEISEETSYG